MSKAYRAHCFLGKAFHAFGPSAGCGGSALGKSLSSCPCSPPPTPQVTVGVCLAWWLVLARALPFKPTSMLSGIEFLC